MDILYFVMLGFHIIVSLGLVLVILAQSSKGGALDGMLGGMATNSLGSQGASDFMKKTTRVLAFVFMLSSILLAVVVKNINTSDAPQSDVQRQLQQDEQQTEALDEQAPAEEAGDAPVQIDVAPAPASDE
ncbi:MAG: preprotein translocase subunit SecG [Candidatus Cloacimonetes bacterium]|nr:preprotein translocase subunit SecG [Candidatus Cloacimonadota bacterium]